MTVEVAKKIVRGIADKIECNTVDIDDWAEFWGFTREEYEEFLDMAIKALEQQPCEDCISREDAINVVHNYFKKYLKLNDDICLDGIRSLPSVTPKARWILGGDEINETIS